MRNNQYKLCSKTLVLSKYIRFNTVITIVDLVFKTAYFILTYTIVSTEEVAKFFLHYM